MKKHAIIIFALSAVTIIAGAQIPNHGFEDWRPLGNGFEPTSWYSTNIADTMGSYFPVTRSADHYPPNIGNYSIRIENRPSLLPGFSAFGLAMTTRLDGSDRPLFAITGHPVSLCGYYKFQPQNGDTMDIHFALYKNGIEITGGGFLNTNPANDWTSFIIQVNNPDYVAADSARIAISSFYSDNLAVQGNSVLYVDNLSFDSLINSVTEPKIKDNLVILSPNPAHDIVFLTFENLKKTEMTVCFYDVWGRKVNSEKLTENRNKINIGRLRNGVYIIVIETGDASQIEKLVIRQ